MKRARQSKKRKNSSLRIEQLENRQLMAVNVTLLDSGTLKVVGDDNGNWIHVTQADGLVKVHNVDYSTQQESFFALNETSVKRLELRGGNATDGIVNSTGIGSDIFGGGSYDELTGGWGSDTIRGGNGNDRIAGGNGNDAIYGDMGADILLGEGGSDMIEGDNQDATKLTLAKERVMGNGAFNDTIDGGADADYIYGQIGSDTIEGGADADWIYGGRGDDTIWGEDSSNTAYYPAIDQWFGDDILVGEDGMDTILGGYGNDFISGGNQADRLVGGWGNDELAGDAGDDSLSGEDGNDRLYGGVGTADVLLGGYGDDWMDAGSASESTEGGFGLDINAFVTAPGGVSSDQVEQNLSGTCWLLAPVAALTDTGVDLSKQITYAGNNQYVVQLFIKSQVAQGGQIITVPSATFVTVDFNGKTNGFDAGIHVNREGSTWVTILNRAVAKLRGETLESIGGNSAAYGFFTLSGRDSTVYTNTFNSRTFIANSLDVAIFAMIQKGIAANRPIAASTWSLVGADRDRNLMTSNQLAVNHVYTVIGTSSRRNAQGGFDRFVTLRNPWGVDTDGRAGVVATGDNDGIVTISWADFARNVSRVTIA